MIWDKAAQYAPIATAAIAALALIIAINSIRVQRAVARRRAAIDLFMKSEMDPAMLDAYDKYEAALNELEPGVSMEKFSKTEAYDHIERYLLKKNKTPPVETNATAATKSVPTRNPPKSVT